MADQRGFFDLDERYAALSKAGDPLERLAALVDFEMFRPALDVALKRSDRTQGGRPPMDAVMMLKVLVLQALYGLSDAQAEFQIMDRRTFGRFLGLDDGDRVPDETTIWRFREALTEAGAIERLFDQFDAHLKAAGYLAMGGQLIDASIIAAPRQRRSEEERAIVKGGGIPEEWQARPAKLAQKDRDARWTLKRGKRKRRPDGTPMAEIATPVFGYKNHITTDRRHGFIRKWAATDAARHDGREFARLLDRANTGSGVWAGEGGNATGPSDRPNAYRSRRNEAHMAKRGLRSQVHFRKPPGKPLPAPRARANATRSAVRSAIEHVFAHQKGPMALFVRTIGIARARTKIGMANLVYNMRRLVWWQGRPTPA